MDNLTVIPVLWLSTFTQNCQTRKKRVKRFRNPLNANTWNKKNFSERAKCKLWTLSVLIGRLKNEAITF